jgi:hypothetical protein
MNKNEAEKIFNAVGGKRKLIAWAKLNSANYGQLLTMLGKSVLQDGVGDVPHAEADPAELSALVMATMEGIINARKRGDVNTASTFEGGASVDVNAGVTKSLHGIADTAAHGGMEESLIEQPLLTTTKKPAAVVHKPARVESIPGLNAGALLDVNGPSTSDDDLYGRSWSQQKAWY